MIVAHQARRYAIPAGACPCHRRHDDAVGQCSESSPIDRINKAACLDYRDHRLGSVASRTIRTELDSLRAALDWGMTEEGERVVERMPDLVLPPKGNNRPRFLTRLEADRLLPACNASHLRLLVEIGLHTGHGRVQSLR